MAEVHWRLLRGTACGERAPARYDIDTDRVTCADCLRVARRCQHCDGTGWDRAQREAYGTAFACEWCDGSGEIEPTDDREAQWRRDVAASVRGR